MPWTVEYANYNTKQEQIDRPEHMTKIAEVKNRAEAISFIRKEGYLRQSDIHCAKDEFGNIAISSDEAWKIISDFGQGKTE